MQLSCGDTCQIWLWLKKSKRYVDKIENFPEKLTNRALVTLIPESHNDPMFWDTVQLFAIYVLIFHIYIFYET